MDPTTSAHIDPSMLTTTASGPDGTPAIVVKPTSSPSTSSSKTSAQSASTSTPPATGLRQRVNKIGTQLDAASDHPAVKNAKGTVAKQIDQLRDILGQSPYVKDIEKRTGVDRVILVVGGVLAYILLIPLNLFGLAYPTTNLLTFLPPTLLAINILDKPTSVANDDSAKGLLAYYVVLGFVQFLESLAAGVLARRIPQYYTLKLILLAYLAHPKTRGALKVHESVFRPILSRASAPSTTTNTPPTSKPFGSTASSSTVQLPSGGGTGVGLKVSQ